MRQGLIIFCSLLIFTQLSYRAVAQRSLEKNNAVDYEDTTPSAEPVSTPTTPEAEPAFEPYKPAPVQQPVEQSTDDFYGESAPATSSPTSPQPSVPSSLNTGLPSGSTGGTTTTTPGSGPISTIPKGNDGIGGTDIPAPPNFEDGEFVKEPLVQDGVYEKIRVKERQVLAYDNIREADVLWSKRIWRVIDTREKMNLTFSYPDQPFVGILLDILNKSDKAKIFVDHDFTLEATVDEVMKQLGSVEEIEVYNPVTELMEKQIVSNDFNPELITKIRIKEDWVFDEESSQMKVRILGIAPIMDKYDDNDNFRGEQPMFWVYYPSIRQDLARYEAYNQFNDAQRMTWEDLLEMRYFASYIYQEGNVRDMRIKDYIANGVDQLIESDNIKRKIFEYEHDLWSY